MNNALKAMKARSGIYKSRGFTLIEIMLAVAMAGIIFTSIFNIYIRGVLFWHQRQDRNEVSESMRIAMDRLSRELRQASKVHAITDNNIQFYDSGNYLITYFIYNQNQLNRKISPNAHSSPIVNNIIKLGAVYDENKHLLNVVITGKGKNTGELSMSTSIYIRALSDG
ncbi:hypothetical protein Dtox_2703 [Desulfofarcimen acetoxidans DSM 771]|jgi:prepilin-type N-terminal cleavage/methylation domain-containing protein|uniref:Prepilin-type N-terminal cleavage/methylation domain-containing protein n=1 Tax=Desulfofarcimen acetoxidans (strain ATCC 49208 / DSM 771 / KCTC 5769 / VKM B-1644 / 5575) TaxID=485916 RepID=C8W186_DESAS|nr:prepilin-type N-terminal cleavage/methylation domain-containing protein [Desulfofarcimen acetoxidans]ACV63482.1 hypothetical protein Dtox_2703 [Desulfofarcimen acetoxidans DSM 771]